MTWGRGDVDHHLGDASRDCSCVSCPPSSTSRPGCLDWPPSCAQHLQGGTAPASTSRSFTHLKMQLRALRRRSMGPRREYLGVTSFFPMTHPALGEGSRWPHSQKLMSYLSDFHLIKTTLIRSGVIVGGFEVVSEVKGFGRWLGYGVGTWMLKEKSPISLEIGALS